MKANSFQSAGSSDGGVERFVVRRDVQFVDETDEAAVGGASTEAKTKPLAGAGGDGKGEGELGSPGLAGDQGGGGGAEGGGESAGVAVGRDGGEVLGLGRSPGGTGRKVRLGEGGDDEGRDDQQLAHGFLHHDRHLMLGAMVKLI